MWLLRFLQAFILIMGRTISILAPVVPTQLESMVPKSRSPHIDPWGTCQVPFQCNIT